MSRILAVLAAFAFAAVLAVTGTAPALAHTARSVRTASAPPPCAAGYYAVQDNHTGTYITGTGINAPVVLGGGNCFELLSEGGGWYSLQNADGHCVWNNGGTVELGKACADRGSELLYGYTQHAGGFWSVYMFSGGGWWDTVANGCATGSDVSLTGSNPNTTCDWFTIYG